MITGLIIGSIIGTIIGTISGYAICAVMVIGKEADRHYDN
jgi:ABC-type lipoprotein release transport system permease subunit